MAIKREHYLSEIRPFYDSDLVKIITGIRRCGKSLLMRMIFDEVHDQGRNCLSLDLDMRPLRQQIPDADSLIAYVKKNRENEKEKCYVFFDEVQNVNGWSEACRTLRLQNCSVFISGSNSRLLSSEFTKELSGRYVSFRIRPFVYQEAVEYAKQMNREYTVSDYLVWGGFPASLEQQNEDSLKRYLTDLNDTIVYNDLENRYAIRRKDIFERIADYVLVSSGRIVSAKSISDYMKSQSVNVSVPTVIKYLGYLKEAYVIYDLPKYSTKTKSKMSYYQKLYDEDVSLSSIRQKEGRFDLTHNFENIVLNELLYRNYEVEVYENNGREIDFRAAKSGKIYLIQAEYSVADEKAYQREFSAFANIDNTYKKIIITNDDVDFSTSTVEHYRFKDFLMMLDL